MAKEKEKKEVVVETKNLDALIKKYGEGAFIDGYKLKDFSHGIVPVSPKLNLILGGGIPGGSVVTLAGPPKAGKTVTSLTIAANGQKQNRPTFYINIEGRIKERDLKGIKGLDPQKLKIIRSYRAQDGTTKIMVAHEYLDCVEYIANTYPGAIIIVDSISQLVTEGERSGALEDGAYAPGAKLMSALCKRICNVISVNDIIIIGILHITANFARFGKNTSITGGNKIKYACDVGLVCTKVTYLKEGGKEEEEEGGVVYGQKVKWITTSTALNAAPCQSTESIIKYGIGIDNVAEIVQLGIDLGFITKGGSWFNLAFMGDKAEKVQGELNLINRIKDSQEEYDLLEKSINEMIG